MSARTLEKSRIALIPSQDVRAIFDADGNFARAMVTELAQCYRSVIKAQKDLKLRTCSNGLRTTCSGTRSMPAAGRSSSLISRRRRLASVLGMTPENLSRAFKGLQPYGVTVIGTRVVIGHQADLETFAKQIR